MAKRANPTNKKIISLYLSGASGRMGRALIRLIAENPGFRLVGGLVRSNSTHLGQDLGALVPLPEPLGVQAQSLAIARKDQALTSADLLIDFSRPEMTREMARLAAANGTPILVGTTGLDKATLAQLEKAAKKVPIMLAANTSIGIALLAQTTRLMAERLGPEWDIEILEMHHRHKKDAPSGTALMLGKEAAAGRAISFSKAARFDRTSKGAEREEGSIGFATLRGGDVAGEHQVIFAKEGERLELHHRVTNRDIFARGALDIVPWLFRQQPGLYEIKDYLGHFGAKPGQTRHR